MRVGVAALASSLLVGVTSGAVSQASATRPPPPTGLSVGDRVRPLNVEGAPLFGWQPQSAHGNDVQTAYQVRVRKAGTGQEV